MKTTQYYINGSVFCKPVTAFVYTCSLCCSIFPYRRPITSRVTSKHTAGILSIGDQPRKGELGECGDSWKLSGALQSVVSYQSITRCQQRWIPGECEHSGTS